MDERLIDVESRLAFQEQGLQQLSDVVARQQDELVTLRQALQLLQRRIESLPEQPHSGSGEEPPPHY